MFNIYPFENMCGINHGFYIRAFINHFIFEVIIFRIPPPLPLIRFQSIKIKWHLRKYYHVPILLFSTFSMQCKMHSNVVHKDAPQRIVLSVWDCSTDLPPRFDPSLDFETKIEKYLVS